MQYSKIPYKHWGKLPEEISAYCRLITSHLDFLKLIVFEIYSYENTSKYENIY